MIGGTVTDKVSGAAIAGATITFSTPATKTTDATGKYSYSTTSNTVTVSATAANYAGSASVIARPMTAGGSERRRTSSSIRCSTRSRSARSGSGSGSVVSAPAGISGAGSKPYNAGTGITLTATPSAGSVFTGWSGACAGTGTCSVTLDASKNVTANFTLMSYTVSTSAGATARIVPSSRLVSSGTTTTFTVTPSSGYHIGTVTGCGGSLVGSTYTTGAVTGDCTVTASFTNAAPTVPVAVSPAGGSEVTTQTPVLQARSTDADGDSINYLYEVSAASDFDPVLTSSSRGERVLDRRCAACRQHHLLVACPRHGRHGHLGRHVARPASS